MSENNKKEVYIETKIDFKQMYEFMMNHAYKSFMGVVGILISIFAVVVLCIYWKDYDITRKVIFIFLALMFTVINPITMIFKAKKQVKANDSFKHPLCYSISEDGIDVSQAEQSLHINWDEIIKVANTKNLVIIYLSAIRAFIFPKEQIGEKLEDFKQIITDNAECGRISIK